MKVRVLKADTPKAMQWRDIENGVGAQNVTDPNNILLKVGSGIGVRLTTTPQGSVNSHQNPGSESMWYVCEVEIQVVPVVPV